MQLLRNVPDRRTAACRPRDVAPAEAGLATKPGGLGNPSGESPLSAHLLKFPLMEAKDREPLFQTLFESSPDAIFIEDMADNVLDCNPAAAALHGTTREQIIGKNVSALVPPERRGDLVTLATTSPNEFEGFSLTAEGRSIPVSIRTSRIQYLGQPALLLHV